jgi:hypothetical protein
VRIAHAVAFLLRCQGAKVPEAMRAVKFTPEESSDPTKQQAVRRAYTKAIGGKKKSPLPVSVDTMANTSYISPMTEPTSTTRTSAAPLETTPPPERDGDSITRKPKPRQIRKTASAMQKWRVNKFDATQHKKRAFKRATSWYAQELEKSKGLSSYQVSKRVKIEFDGVGPSAQTLQRYAKWGIAGQSPQKPGVKSDIPKWAYNSLTVAFESYVRINQLNRRDDVLTLTKLATKVNETMGHNYKSKLLNRVLLSTAK